LKIARTETGFIRDGDEITVAVTHEVKIGGESSWIRYEAKTKVNQETCEDASERVIRFVNAGVMNAVHKTVEEVRNQQ
jgi:hypothetical protein